jgi:drug/metabolite transporter (DMT)-like permease
MTQSRLRIGAILLVAITAALAPIGDYYARMLGVAYSAAFIAFGRFLIGGAFGLAGLSALGQYCLPRGRAWLSHFWRAGLLAGSILCFIAALPMAPLVDVVAGFYLAPAFAAAMGAALLKERSPPQKTLGVGLSLCGAIAIIDPTGAMSIGGGLAVVAGVMFAVYLVGAWLAPASEDPRSAAVTQSLLAALIVAPFALAAAPDFQVPPIWVMVAFALIGTISGACQCATLIAHKFASTSTLAPFFYTALISSLLIGVALLNEAPSPAGLVGVLLIGAGGLLVAMFNETDTKGAVPQSSA